MASGRKRLWLAASISLLVLLVGLWVAGTDRALQMSDLSPRVPGGTAPCEVGSAGASGLLATGDAVTSRAEVEVEGAGAAAAMVLARVLGPGGEWVDGCDVEVIPNGRVFARGTTSGGGWFRAETSPSSPAIVVARSGRLLGQAVWEPELVMAKETSHVVVQLRPGGSIVGTVVHGVDRRPMALARVMALRRELVLASLDRAHRGGYTVEVVADELGQFELVGLVPDAEYVLHAAVDGHVSAAAGVVSVARSRGAGEDDGGRCEVEVLPALGALVQFVDGTTGVTLPATFSQTARMYVSGAPGEELSLHGVVLEEMELRESAFLGRERHGLRAFVYRVATTRTESASVVLTVESTDHSKVKAELALVPISPRMRAETVVLHSSAGPLQPVTLRLLGYPSERAYRFPGSDQVHLEHAYGRARSLFVVPDRRGEVHLALPEGNHRLRFEGGGGWVSLPQGEAGTYTTFSVAGPTVVELNWPPEPVGALLDLRDSEGNPKWDFCMVYWTRADPSVELPTTHGRGFRTVLLAEAPYWIPSWTPGHYDVWVDGLGVGPGYRVEVPDHGGAPGSVPRVRIDLAPRAETGAR